MTQRNNNWRQLDNAAKIFPATSGKRDERVFRFACELKEEVNPQLLQDALDSTIKMFPMFLCVLRKGFFWFYFEERDIRPIVQEENQRPCSRLYIRDQKNLLFRVFYYKKRIGFEVFHALTDGTGALQFLKHLVFNYLKLIYPDALKDVIYNYDATNSEKEEDGFKKYYEKVDKNIKIPKYKSYQLRGKRFDFESIHLIEGKMSVKEVLNIAKQYNTTMTVLLTAIYLQSIGMEIAPRHINKTVALMVPVNLRNFFPSASLRNFFGWIDVGYDFATQSMELKDIISFVSEFFKQELTAERMAARANEFVKIEENILARIIPLQFKIIGLKIAAIKSRSSTTAILSNIGKVSMPKECTPYIDNFDVFTSTPKIEISLCSFNDNLVISCTSAFENTNIQRNFFRTLTGMGLSVEISAIDK